jgi:tetratricopeptide (TPR) repeat protein
VDARDTWQALQARLTNARAAFDAGDRAGALVEVDAALTIDPNFLAAQSLRERILVAPAGLGPTPPAPAAAAADATAAAPGVPPTFPGMEGYARFEQRAKRRRVDRRLDAARLALETGRLKAAAAALDEVIELDPNLPDLHELTAAFDNLRRSTAASHRGPRVAAASVFVVTLLGASWLHESTSLISRPMIAAAPPLATPSPISAVVEFEPIAVRTAGEREAAADAIAPLVVHEPAETRLTPAVTTAGLVRPPVEIPEMAPPMPTVAPVAPPVVAAPRVVDAVNVAALEAPVNAVAALPPAPTPVLELSVDDNQLVKQTLQRYRVAYEGLDARKAHAVWPAVNQAALARAFDGLESQSLTFDACDVRVRGELATAICQGSARYVPKIGSREPRTERRVWNFSLHKAGDDWQIESARANR